MTTQPTPTFGPGDATYDIRINEQQRRVLQLAAQIYLENVPLEAQEYDRFGTQVAVSLEDMLNPDGATGPLYDEGLNSFVM